jgi:uncharacterized membrane protein
MKLVLAPLFVTVGLLFIGLAIPLIRRRIKPNKTYGLRVQATFADEWVWYEANAGTGRDLLYGGLCQLAAALLLLPAPAIAYSIINVGAILVSTLWMVAVGISRADRLLKQRRAAQLEANSDQRATRRDKTP